MTKTSHFIVSKSLQCPKYACVFEFGALVIGICFGFRASNFEFIKNRSGDNLYDFKGLPSKMMEP